MSTAFPIHGRARADRGRCGAGIVFGFLIAALGQPGLGAEAPRGNRDSVKFQRVIHKVFGEAAQLDATTRNRVLAAKPGQRHYVDRNDDGKPEEVWYIDLDSRHPEAYRPVLVKVVDRSGRLKMGGEPDRHHALYVADWNANGSVDALIEYHDLDGDSGLDEMVMYLESTTRPGSLMAYWSRDVGHDHLLWFDVAYTYVQAAAQWRTHFNGDEEFAMFYLDELAWQWVPTLENPFCFYDRDRDGVSEEAIRVVTEGTVKSIRHSFDADNRGTRAHPYSYDVSVTAIAPPNLEIPARYGESIRLHGIPSRPILKFDLAPAFVGSTTWEKTQLTWVENAHNIAAERGYPARHDQRWEGVINHESAYFPRVGGPSCGPFNNRVEIVSKPSGPIRLYFHPTDRRLHLYEANHAWIEIDADMDYKAEMRYELIDSDRDGVIDTWKLDRGSAGVDTWHCRQPKTYPVNWNWHEINASWEPIVRDDPPKLFALVQQLEAAIASIDPAATEDAIFKLLRSNFQSQALTPEVARKFIGSDATVRFYLDVIKDRLIGDLKTRFRETEFWTAFGEARSEGDYTAMGSLLQRRFGLGNDLEKYADWIERGRAAVEPPRVGWAKFGPSIGWESERVAYRCYWGRVDFFGKRGERLIYADMGGTRKPGEKWALAAGNYHEEREWGMDALDIGESSGAGGITLYINGEAFPVQSSSDKGPMRFESRLVSAEARRVTVEMLATAVGKKDQPYTVRIRFSATAGRNDSAVEVVVNGGKSGDRLELGIGLTKLAQEAFLADTESGVMATWGVQSPAIGSIGLGILFPPDEFLRLADLPDERQVVVQVHVGNPLRYGIQCDWLRGRTHSVSPTASDWLNVLRQSAASFRSEDGRGSLR